MITRLALRAVLQKARFISLMPLLYPDEHHIIRSSSAFIDT